MGKKVKKTKKKNKINTTKITKKKKNQKKWSDKEKEEKVWEKSVLKDTKEKPIDNQLKESLNQLSEDCQEEEELKEFPPSSMKTPELSSRASWKMSSEIQLHTQNMLEERLLPL